jgi:hypothetical protein
MVLAVSMNACASEKGAQGSSAGAGGESGAVDGERAWAAREALGQVLLDCARLTFSSTEAAQQSTVFLDEQNRVAALEVVTPDGTASTLMCPGDRQGTASVLHGKQGASWGRRPARGFKVEAYCAPGFEGSRGGCGVRQEELDASAAPVTGGTTAKAAAVTAIPSVERSKTNTRYQLRRLAADIDSGEAVNLEQQLSMLDAGLLLCLHSRQPNLSITTSTDFTLRMEVSTGSRAMVAPFTVKGGKPDALWNYLQPCLQDVAGDDGAKGMGVTVRYSTVPEVTDTPAGRFVQQVNVEFLREELGMTASQEARSAFVARLGAAIKRCVELNPVEAKGAVGRWATLGSLRLAAEVDTQSRDDIRLVDLVVTSAESDRDRFYPVKPALTRQARCVVDTMPQSHSNAPAAKGAWVFAVSASSLPPN